MNTTLIFSTTLLVINIISIICLIFFERKNPSTTWAWVLVLTFLPGIGFLIYLLFGQNLSRQRLFTQKIIDDKNKNLYLKTLIKNYKYDLTSIENKDLIIMNYKNSNSIYTQNNSVNLYFHGDNLFKDIFKEVENAKNFIHLEYYIFKSDDLGLKLLKLLTKKAKEGVEVKLLIDSMGNGISKKYLNEFKTAGGKYSIFFPSFFTYINKRINYRNHRKIVVIDGNIAFLGGFNVGDEYLGNDKKIGYWRDTHLKIEGDGVNDLECRFLLDWTYSDKDYNMDYKKYFKLPIIKKDLSKNLVPLQIVSSGPDHIQQQIKNGIIKTINNSKRSIYIQTPYFVPDDSLLHSLQLAGLSGVDVKLMIPGKPDHIFMMWVANSYLSDLLKCGVKVYLYNKGFLHAKTLVCDSKICSIGTANLDIRSFSLNFETNAFIYNNVISIKMEEQFLKDLNDCSEVTLDEFKKRSLLNKFFESICRLLSPIM